MVQVNATQAIEFWQCRATEAVLLRLVQRWPKALIVHQIGAKRVDGAKAIMMPKDGARPDFIGLSAIFFTPMKRVDCSKRMGLFCEIAQIYGHRGIIAPKNSGRAGLI